jgi:ATP-binding cassette subfamily E protein 1
MSKAASRTRKKDKDEAQDRIAIINPDKCKPKKCKQECKRFCPVVRMGKLCIEVTPASKVAFLSESLCIGCGICTKKCPFEAITIINLPKDLQSRTTHRYGPNAFKLHGLPTPRAGEVLGLVGTNGIGKSTALKVLGGKLKPNLGDFETPPDWAEILKYFRGSELQNFFTKMLEDNLKAVMKPQYVDLIPKKVKGTVGDILSARDEAKSASEIAEKLDLVKVWEREIDKLSGGELQRFAIAAAIVQNGQVIMFDEPSSYLDVKQRLQAGRVIREQVKTDNYVIVVEHDLSILDYLSDFVCVLYGKPGAYGVVTLPSGVREGINIFLDGFIPTENLRFREESLTFRVAEVVDDVVEKFAQYTYPPMTKTLGTFKLTIEKGSFSDSEIIVMLGQNGCGKTTFIRMLAGLLESDTEEKVPTLNVSYKPQKIAPKFEGTVRQLLHVKIKSMYTNPQFIADVMKPMNIEPLMNEEVGLILRYLC